jgi:hypothetical protein
MSHGQRQLNSRADSATPRHPLGHTWGMDHRTTRATSGLSRTPRSRYLAGEMFGASRALRAGFFLTRKRSQVQTLSRPPSSPEQRGRSALPELSVISDICWVDSVIALLVEHAERPAGAAVHYCEVVEKVHRAVVEPDVIVRTQAQDVLRNVGTVMRPAKRTDVRFPQRRGPLEPAAAVHTLGIDSRASV